MEERPVLEAALLFRSYHWTLRSRRWHRLWKTSKSPYIHCQ